jgi:hypothetical protein
MRESDYNRARKAEGMIAGYQVSKANGAKDAAAIYREQALGMGVDPATPGKNDPLSSQVSAAKAVLNDIDASDVDKSAARQVLRIANESFAQQRTGELPKNGSEQSKSASVMVNGKSVSYESLKSGDTFTDPDGIVRRKK